MQRVALAMAFLPKPKVLVLDEPTTGLDVTTQGMVLQTMGELCRSHGVAALYVTHDLAVIANIADRVAVMYAGQIAELGDRDDALRAPLAPLHPGAARLDPAPQPGARAERHPRPHPGARGAARRAAGSTTAASSRIDECRAAVPELRDVAPDHQVRCIRVDEIGSWDISRGTVPDTDPDKPRDIILTSRTSTSSTAEAGRPRRHLRRRQGGGRRAGRRVRQRQDHDLALRRRSAQGVDRHDRLRGQRARPRARASAASRTASGSSTSSRTRTCR